MPAVNGRLVVEMPYVGKIGTPRCTIFTRGDSMPTQNLPYSCATVVLQWKWNQNYPNESWRRTRRRRRYSLEDNVTKKIGRRLPLQWNAGFGWCGRMRSCILIAAAIDQFHQAIGRRRKTSNNLIRWIRTACVYHETAKWHFGYLWSNLNAQHLSLIHRQTVWFYAEWRPWCGRWYPSTVEWC